HNASECPISDNPQARFQHMLDLARTTPAMFDYKGRPLPLSTGWVTLLSVLSIYTPDSYPSMARTINGVLQPVPDWTPLIASASGMAGADSLGPTVWTSCMDQPLPRPADYDALVAKSAAAAPLTGAVQANINRPCAYLP